MAEETETKVLQEQKETVKKTKMKEDGEKRGVVYLSCIPRGMSLKRLREEMEKYGEVGNIYLEPDDKAQFNPHQRVYKEGWVEFLKKAVAKQVAAMLNNTQVGGRQKNPWKEDIWNIKYLPKFQWAHLNARLAYEKGVYKQRLRADISQIKREATFHKKNFAKSKIRQKQQQKEGEEAEDNKAGFTVRQRETEEEILTRKRQRVDDDDDEGGAAKKKKRARRERPKKSLFRPDADHPVGALSLGANPQLLQKLFGGGGGS
ncbi:uncharacterized protein LOC143291279 [Babylonia areolata]|uniref:uncharacterized protein LOC143291279 n=1 Tax=Babylonia areolata TaxID=304850 RepID=UPI003FD5B7D9